MLKYGISVFVVFMVVISFMYVTKKNPEPETGLGGWLLFFVMLMSLILAVTLPYQIQDLLEWLHDYPQAATGIYLWNAVQFSWLLAWLVCLYKVAYIRSGAVTYVKIMLLGQIVFVTVFPLIFMACMEYGSGIRMLHMSEGLFSTTDHIKQITKTALPCLIWYTYFTKSKRVRNTWPEANHRMVLIK